MEEKIKGWIARDNVELFLYETKPYCIRGIWHSSNEYGKTYKLDRSLFPDLTFENSPQEVEITIKTI